MPTKRKTGKAEVQEEQVQLLRQILVELQRLNVSLGAGKADTQGIIEPDKPPYDSDDDEELEEYE